MIGGHIGNVFVYLKSDKTKSFKLKSTVFIYNYPINEELTYIKSLKHYFPEFETIKFRYHVFNTCIQIYIENDEDYELLKSKYEWK